MVLKKLFSSLHVTMDCREPVNVCGILVVAFRPAPNIIGPVAYIPGLIPHQAGRAKAPFHDAFEALPINGAVAVHIEIPAGAFQPFFIVRRQLARQRRQRTEDWEG